MNESYKEVYSFISSNDVFRLFGKLIAYSRGSKIRIEKSKE